MGYSGQKPLPVSSGMTGASSLTGVLSGNGTTSFAGSALTEHYVLVGGASNAISSLNPSTAGFILTTGATDSTTNFTAVAGKSLVFISTQNATNSASINFTSAISASYSTYVLFYYNVYPVTDNVNLSLALSNDNGGTWIAADYLSGVNYYAYTATAFTNANATTFIPLGQGLSNSTSNVSSCGYIYFYNMNQAIIPTVQSQNLGFVSGGTLNNFISGGTNTVSNTINAFQLLMSSGNISTGTFTLYGMKES